MSKEFHGSNPDQLMIKIRENLVKSDVVASPVDEENLLRYIPCFTGAFIVYDIRPRFRFPEAIKGIPSQSERILDLDTLYSNNETSDKKLDIISKYKITHIVSKNKIENIPNEIILEIHHTTFFNESYYLYLLTREGGEHVFPVKKS